MITTNNFIELMNKIIEYCINKNKKNMVRFIEISINNFKNNNNQYESYKLLFYSIFDKMEFDNWTNEEKYDMYYKTAYTIPAFNEENMPILQKDEVKFVQIITTNNFIELINKIREYCNKNINKKKQKMFTFIEISINNFKNDYNLRKNYKVLFYSILKKMKSDNWTENEENDMYYKTAYTIPAFNDNE